MRQACWLIVGALALTLASCEEEPEYHYPPEAFDPEYTAVQVTEGGTYEHDPWKYDLQIRARGTRSEGHYGFLDYNGQPVPEPANYGDYYVTPWGMICWVGQPDAAWGMHGWMPACMVSRESIGERLPESGGAN